MIVGTYRLLRQDQADRHFGFYSAGEYDIAPVLAGPLQAGAAEHRVDAVVQHVGPDAVPQELDRAFGASRGR
jgi:putative hemolysin